MTARASASTHNAAPAPERDGTSLTVEFERERDGRWIADVPELPGVMAYGRTRKHALGAVQALAFEVLAADVKRGRRDPKALMRVLFTVI
jgi:predicted RNase H-like HicB family nuclease